MYHGINRRCRQRSHRVAMAALLRSAALHLVVDIDGARHSHTHPPREHKHAEVRVEARVRGRVEASMADAMGRMTSPLEGAGAIWRIRVARSGRFVYCHGDAVITTPSFFSLFQLLPQADGAYALVDHAGDALYVPAEVREEDGLPRLSLLGRVSPPSHNAKQRSAETTGATAAVSISPSTFTLHPLPGGHPSAYVFSVRGAKTYLYEDAYARIVATPHATSWWWPSKVPITNSVNASGHLLLERVVAPNEERQSNATSLSEDVAVSFARRVSRVWLRVADRRVVVATYHNIGMMDWATLFWAWLRASRIDRFFLLELDGLTCSAARNLNCSAHFECATAADMRLPKEYTEIRQASALQDWGTSAQSPYFKFLRWKLRFVELVLAQGADVLMADVDVLILTPQFLPTLAATQHDLLISSDARQGNYSNNRLCPCSHAAYQRYTTDWVCAGLFYVRSTDAGSWLMREVQKLMDDFTITDQDAIQAVLTGHTQVVIPQMRPQTPLARRDGGGNRASGSASAGGSGGNGGTRHSTHTGAAFNSVLRSGQSALEEAAGAGFAATTAQLSQEGSAAQLSQDSIAGAWLKPLLLQELETVEKPADASAARRANARGKAQINHFMQPLNVPMKEAMWRRLLAEQAANGFSWQTMPLHQFGNGPMLVHHWDSIFRHADGATETLGSAAGSFLSIHANCQTKAWLAADTQAASFLLHPEGVATLSP